MHVGDRHPHDLENFLSRSAAALKAEYSRIRARASEDPGTAGDEGEEDWRELLENWLPSDLTVTTKGRIIGANGQLSRQVDVVVLRPGYPRALANRKVYLAGGVLAAFECKLTLKPGHIASAARNARLIRRLAPDRVGSPYVESHSPIIFGVLAHSTTLVRAPAERIDALLQTELMRDSHPRDVIDAVCIADLASWNGWTVHIPRTEPSTTWQPTRELYALPEEGGSMVMYTRSEPSADREPTAASLWALIDRLTKRIAWEHADYRAMSQYLTVTQGPRGGSRSVAGRTWGFEYLSEGVEGQVRRGGLTNRGWAWDPWGMAD